jgi:hypothetical protein
MAFPLDGGLLNGRYFSRSVRCGSHKLLSYRTNGKLRYLLYLSIEATWDAAKWKTAQWRELRTHIIPGHGATISTACVSSILIIAKPIAICAIS